MAKKPDVPCADGCGKLLWSSGTSLPAGQRKCRDCRRDARPEPTSKPALSPRTCIGCGADYMPRVHEQQRCKKGCGRQHRRAARDCEICSQPYQPTHTEQRTCGRGCGEALRRSVTGTMPVERQWPRSTVHFPTCLCGVLFAARKETARYCPSCQAKGASHCTMLRYYSDPAFRDDFLARAHARRAGKLGAGHEMITITYLVERDRGRCGICRTPVRGKRGTSRGPSIDHIVPLSRGGMHELVNVHLAHLDCNISKNCFGGGEQLLLFG